MIKKTSPTFIHGIPLDQESSRESQSLRASQALEERCEEDKKSSKDFAEEPQDSIGDYEALVQHQIFVVID